jgi:GNAT superfamily N-acetyltransferase
MHQDFYIRPARPEDVPQILAFIRELAEYEKLTHQAVGTPEQLHEHLFGVRPYAEVILLETAEGKSAGGAGLAGECAGFALFFHNYSTFLTRPGIYLEDLYVQPQHRGKGYGKALLLHLAKLAALRGCGRLEWAVLDWNAPAIGFYESLGATMMNEWRTFRLTGDTLESLAAQASG